MRAIVLATSAVLLLIGGIWTAAFTAVGSSDQPTLIGPAVVVGSTASPSGTPAGSPGAPSGEPTDDHGVHAVSPSPAVEVSDDRGGRGKGKSDD